MVSRKILEQHGCTQAKLREIFTAKKGRNAEIRERFQDKIQSRILEGIQFGARNSKLYMSVDVAWDDLPINKATIPLLQYAQGKINIEQCQDKLENMGMGEQFCDYDEEGNLKKIDTLRLYEVSVNLIRSYVTRRVAAQVSRFSNLFPYFKYEPRSTNVEDKLRADVLSQRVEMMTDQFGYRHQWEQIIRQMFMYGHSVAFPSEAWTRKVQWRHEKNEMTGEDDLKSYIEKEGIQFFTPHPTRMMWDTTKPLHDINNDQGPEWIGYWDIIRYGDIKDSTDCWNIDEVSYTNSLSTLYDTHADFFNYYFQSDVMRFPGNRDTFAFQNERTANTGIYSSEDEDKGMFVSNIFMRCNPLRDGLGDYPHDVWVKFTVASDETVLFAEFMPSIPAIYGGINENDDRLSNISVAHEIMPFQDQLSNIMSKMLHDMKISMMKIFCIDQDALDDEVKEYIRDGLSEDSFYAKPKALFYSGQKAADLGIDNKNFITIVDAQKELSGGINQSIQAILQLLNLVERLLILSPQELGQAAPREISATEVAEIANTTNSVYSFISEGIDDMRSAAKRMIYDHLISCSESDFVVPIKSRYTQKSIEDAGFVSETDESGPASRNIIGTPTTLIHEYLFSSRDGAERARDTQSAQVLGNLLQSVLQLEGIAQSLGKERIFEMFNEIFRLSGAHDLKLETDEYDDSAEQQKTIQDEQFFQQLKQQFPQVLQSLQELAQVVQGLAGGQKQIASAAAQGMQTEQPQPQQKPQQANTNPEVQTKV
jgi:hypothetical protein